MIWSSVTMYYSEIVYIIIPTSEDGTKLLEQEKGCTHINL